MIEKSNFWKIYYKGKEYHVHQILSPLPKRSKVTVTCQGASAFVKWAKFTYWPLTSKSALDLVKQLTNNNL